MYPRRSRFPWIWSNPAAGSEQLLEHKLWLCHYEASITQNKSCWMWVMRAQKCQRWEQSDRSPQWNGDMFNMLEHPHEGQQKSKSRRKSRQAVNHQSSLWYWQPIGLHSANSAGSQRNYVIMPDQFADQSCQAFKYYKFYLISDSAVLESK